MSGATSKVVTGCAIGCVVLLLMAGVLAWMGYRWTRGAIEKADQAAADEGLLEERFGEVRDFRPPLDLGFSEERFAVFLAIRDQLTSAREDLAETVAGFAPVGDGNEPATGWRTAGAGVRLAPRLLELGRVRNRTLLESGMGLGEYMWYYSLAYYAFLGRPPAESELHRYLEERRAAGSTMQVNVGGDLEPDGVAWRLHRDLLAMLRNLSEDLAADHDATSWHGAVDAEVLTVTADPERVPWQDGLPEVLAERLEPHRMRLEATYSPATNIFELVALE
jgi:hypothetical protein